MFFRGASDVLYFDTQQFSIPVIHNTSIHDVFDRSVCAFFLSRLTFGYLSQSLHQKIQYSRFFFLWLRSLFCDFFYVSFFYSFFLVVFSIRFFYFAVYFCNLQRRFERKKNTSGTRTCLRSNEKKTSRGVCLLFSNLCV